MVINMWASTLKKLDDRSSKDFYARDGTLMGFMIMVGGFKIQISELWLVTGMRNCKFSIYQQQKS